MIIESRHLFKVHYLDLDKSETPIDPTITYSSRKNKHELLCTLLQQRAGARDRSHYKRPVNICGAAERTEVNRLLDSTNRQSSSTLRYGGLHGSRIPSPSTESDWAMAGRAR